MKICLGCKKEKQESEFYRRGGNRHDFQSLCKMCSKCREIGRKLYYKNYNKLRREKQKTYYQNRREYYRIMGKERVRELKWKYIQLLSGKCSNPECTIIATKDNMCIFDFHHIEHINKQTNERRGMENPSNTIFDITKVILLCSNHHRLEHIRKKEGK